MNVLYLIHHAGKGGTERYVWTLAETLKGGGRVSPLFACTEDGLLRERMEALGVPVFRIAMNSRYSLRAARTVAKLCRERRIDVIHTQFLRENYIALLSRLFYPNVRVVYTNHLILPNNLLTRLSNRVLSRLQHAVSAVCNPGQEQMVRNGIPAKLIRVIHNGVDPAQWTRPADSAVRRELGVADNMPVILYAARFVEGKGHECLLQALSMLADVPFRMLFAGDGPLLDEMRERAAALGLAERTVFLGFRKDMPDVLGAADICVNAASTEACSFNILEAMAMGIPQAAADAGGNADLIDGENGLLFRDNDPQALSEALRRLLTDKDLRERCARNAAERARTSFHIRDTVDKTFAMYQ